MNVGPNLVGQSGLTYFGRTTASISHELKNALAIIKENAGLLGDYLLMADKGVSIDPARFKTVATRIEDQVARADGIIKNLNRFAHSVDDPVKVLDLNELAGLLGVLSQREAAMRQVTLHVCPESATTTVTTAPYLLLTLLGRCLSVCLQYMGAGKALAVRVTKEGAGGRISFESLDAAALATAGTFPGENESALLSAVGADYHLDGTQGRMAITLSNR
ncbi:MAG: sensor histidine kinase [Desulfobacterales bacterium]|nr:sensor histidine kinase [Desulfobacterales bacterium]